MDGQRIVLKIYLKEYEMFPKSEFEEHLMRVAAEEINKKISGLDTRFSEKEAIDKFIILAFQQTVSRLVCEKRLKKEEGELSVLNDELAAYLKGIDK